MYPDIGDHGIIGNPRTAALVRRNGSIDWCCLPRFHSPSVYAALLDDESGGRFAVSLTGDSSVSQRYESETNVLRTRLSSGTGTIRIIDFMPAFMDRGELTTWDEIIRLVQCMDGAPTVSVDFDPRLDYARGDTNIEPLDTGCRATNGEESVSLVTPIDLKPSDTGATGRHRLREGEEFFLICRYDDPEPNPLDSQESYRKLERTRQYWSEWSDRCVYEGPWQETVLRSALALKALTYESTGAIAAAATTSLPEMPGGSRNWDYRFAWIRDTVFSAWSLHQLDYQELGIQFLQLLERKLDPEAIPPLVDVEGDPVPDEEELDHLDGYRGAKPVRVGNAAADQDQWDSYGAMIDGAYFSHRKLGGIETDVYEGFVRPAVDHICDVWDQPDHGIWEVRGGKRHFTNSKVWCWVVLDRGIKVARGQGFRDDIERWKPHREAIRKDVLEKGWSEELGAFKIAYGTEALDASLLMMPLVGFLPARDPKMRRTIEVIEEGLAVGPLLYRYRPEEVHSDPIDVGDSPFTTCSFWLIVCRARLGQTEAARERFDELLDYSNHLGLFAEELDPDSGKQLGNFPQAYVHMALINAAIELNHVLE